MSRLVVLAVRDRMVDAFLRPMFMQSVGQAVRAFTDEVNRVAEDNPMYKHPEDYELFRLGVWDERDGSFEVVERPESVALASNVKR